VGSETLPLYIDAGLVPLRLTTADATQGLGFTLQPMTAQIAPVAAKALTTWIHASSVAIILDSTQAYPVAANAAIQQELATAGVTVTAEVAVTPRMGMPSGCR
jgi:ABC-type branched-subunit amino acid transport system substrate-binding protein